MSYKNSYSNKEVNGTEPSPSVSFPWRFYNLESHWSLLVKVDKINEKCQKDPGFVPNFLYQIGSKILIGRHKLFPNGIIPIQELRHSLGHVFKSKLGRFMAKCCWSKCEGTRLMNNLGPTPFDNSVYPIDLYC
jgi:hypothetical protein